MSESTFRGRFGTITQITDACRGERGLSHMHETIATRDDDGSVLYSCRWVDYAAVSYSTALHLIIGDYTIHHYCLYDPKERRAV